MTGRLRGSTLVSCVLLAAVVAAQPAAAATFAELKPAAQVRAEAALYDQAVKAMNSLAATRIVTLADFANARKLFATHAGNMRYAAVRMVALGYQDARYAKAIAAQLTSAAAAESFAKRLAADYRVASRLDGAAELRLRMAAALQANTAAYQRALDTMHAAALRLGLRIPGVRPKYFSPPDASIWNPQVEVIFTTIAVTFPAIANEQASSTGYTVNPAAITGFLGAIRLSVLQATYEDIADELRLAMEQREAMQQTFAEIREMLAEACKRDAQTRREACYAEAAALPADQQASARESCDWAYTMDVGLCTTGVRVGGCSSLLCAARSP